MTDVATDVKKTDSQSAKNLRRKKKSQGRRKRLEKLKTDPEYKKAYFEAKSKRSTEKKSAFRKQKTKKK